MDYQEILAKHNTESVKLNPLGETTWAEFQVGTDSFWSALTLGIIGGFEDAAGFYTGTIIDYYVENDYAPVIWIDFGQDPTRSEIPKTQNGLPVAFGLRDKIWMEKL